MDYSIMKLSPQPELILVTGDIADYGCNEDSGCHNHYTRFWEAVDEAVKKGIKVYCVPGNHDIAKKKDDYCCDCSPPLRCYNTNINRLRPPGASQLPGLPDSNNYYFEHEDFLFVGLDSGPGGYGPLGLQGGGLDADQIGALELCLRSGRCRKRHLSIGDRRWPRW
ncbi:MAG: metallophosphoesterase [Sedimentisphaerales bacterium]|nr:metallophosphoesterase [Sedimentisphaerales bacterium]